MNDIDKLVDQTIDDPQADGWHRVAGNAWKTSTCGAVDLRTAQIYRHVEAENILRAVFTTHPHLTAREMLLVSARLLERQETIDGR